tara:strand:+ start:5158 stop:5967 length:810 start_codon:yes stop_codon:yes gene_type:complete
MSENIEDNGKSREDQVREFDQQLANNGVNIHNFPSRFMFGADLGEDWVNLILPDVYEILNDPASIDYTENLAAKIDYGLQVGVLPRQYTKPFLYLKDVIHHLSTAYVNKYLLSVWGGSVKFEGTVDINDMWIVKQLADDYNPVHDHSTISPCGLSGVVYIKSPPQILDVEEDRTSSQNSRGQIKLWAGPPTATQQPNSFHPPSVIQIRPKPGQLILFPKDTPHGVDPFKGDGDRICIAFNVNIWYHNNVDTTTALINDLKRQIAELKNK